MGKSLANSFGRSKVRKTLQTLGLQTGGFDKSNIPAFPGAEGGGMYTPGGRGGKVIVVTSPGRFRSRHIPRSL